MRRRVVVTACFALLLCVPCWSVSFADEYATPRSDDLGVSPTGAIGPKSVTPAPGVSVTPPARGVLPPASGVLPPASGVLPPAPGATTGFFDSHEDVAPPPPPIELQSGTIKLPSDGEGPHEIVPVEPPPYVPPPYEGPVVVDPPVYQPPPPAPAPRLRRRENPSSCDPDCGQRRDDCCWPVDDCDKRYGCTTLTLEGSYGLLNDPQGVLGTPAFGFANQFDWDDLDYEGAFGGRITLEHAMAPQKWIQIRGAYYGSWDDSASSVGVFGFTPGNIFTAGGHQRPGVTNDIFGTLSSEADLYGAEINYADEVSCSGCTRWDVIFGLRYLQFDENARFDSTVAPIPGFTGPAFVASDVENVFVGLQAGARWHYQPSQNFELTASLKVMGGNINRQVTVTDRSIFAGGPHSASSEEDEIVLGADIEIGARLRVSRVLALTIGYNLVFLDNVLRANDAMDFSASGSGAVQATQNTDQVLWHGVFAGLQLNF